VWAATAAAHQVGVHVLAEPKRLPSQPAGRGEGDKIGSPVQGAGRASPSPPKDLNHQDLDEQGRVLRIRQCRAAPHDAHAHPAARVGWVCVSCVRGPAMQPASNGGALWQQVQYGTLWACLGSGGGGVRRCVPGREGLRRAPAYPGTSRSHPIAPPWHAQDALSGLCQSGVASAWQRGGREVWQPYQPSSSYHRVHHHARQPRAEHKPPYPSPLAHALSSSYDQASHRARPPTRRPSWQSRT